MKINANSLVAVKPGIVPVAHRPSPGVFTCPCSGDEPTVCTPAGLGIPAHDFPIASYEIGYKINDGITMTWTFNPPLDWTGTISAQDLFSAFLRSSYGQVGIDNQASIVGSGGGIGAFQYASSYLAVAAAPDPDSETEYAESNTIQFFAVLGQTNDPIQTLFEVDSLTVHSCGVVDWPGL